MQVGIMITNGGPHPPEMWASQSADRIVDLIEVEPTFPKYAEALQQKNVLRDMIRDTMLEHHQAVQNGARKRLAASGETDPSHVESVLSEAVGIVQRASQGTMFEAHFQQPEVMKVVEDTLRNHLNTVVHIEHSWHRDRQGA